MIIISLQLVLLLLRVECQRSRIRWIDGNPWLSFCSQVWVFNVLAFAELSLCFYFLDHWLRSCNRFWLGCFLLSVSLQYLRFEHLLGCYFLLLLFLLFVSLTSNLLTFFYVCQIFLYMALPHFLFKLGPIFHYHFNLNCFFASLVRLRLVFLYFAFLLCLLNLLK